MPDTSPTNGVIAVPPVVAEPQGIVVTLDKPRRISLNLWTVYQVEREWERRHQQALWSESLLRPLLMEPYSAIPITKLILLMQYGLRPFDATVTFEQAAALCDYRLLDEVLAQELQASLAVPPDPTALAPALPFQEGIPIMLDQPRRLRLGFWAEYCAAREYEQLRELPAESIDSKRDILMDHFHATALLLLLKNGLRTQLEPPPLSLEQVGRAIPLLKVFSVLKTVQEAWEAASPPRPAEEPAPEETAVANPPALTGAPSGPVGVSTST